MGERRRHPMTLRERHRPERIIAFSDAVVAIAITVLLLPLAGLDTEDGDVLGLLSANSQLLWGLTLTWAIIAVFWFGHHRLFEHIEAVDRVVLWLNFGWLFAVALLPLPTSIVVRNEASAQVTGFYIGWMAVISLLMSALLWYARRTPGLMPGGSSWEARTAQARTFVISGIFVIAFATALVAPGWATYLLLLLFLAEPLSERLVRQ